LTAPKAGASAASAALPGVTVRRARSRPRRKVDVRAVVGVAILLTVVAAALVGPIFTSFDPLETDLSQRLKPPGWSDSRGIAHVLGTDELGRDVLARIYEGGRVSLLVGATAVLITGTLGVALGVLSGYFRGIYDHVIMRVADIQLAFPFLLLAIAIMAVLRPSLLNVVLVLVVSGWVGFARLTRAQTFSVTTREYFLGAKVVGCSDARIIRRYLLPNIMAPIIVLATYQVPQTILAEASLSFLGLGVQPPTPTWGSSIATGRDYLATAWWLSTLPGLVLMVTVVGIGLIGDWLRDTLDPTLRVRA
jgi:peptide/nickel transport system permease protein